MTPSTDHLALPFFDAAHRDIAARLPEWAAAQDVDERDDRAACRDWVRRLGDAGWRVHAVSRQARSDTPGRHWLQCEFARMPDLPATVDAIFSCGPLDLFARWYADAARVACPRVVAFGYQVSSAVQDAVARVYESLRRGEVPWERLAPAAPLTGWDEHP